MHVNRLPGTKENHTKEQLRKFPMGPAKPAPSKPWDLILKIHLILYKKWI
jgi:hypothetical protein